MQNNYRLYQYNYRLYQYNYRLYRYHPEEYVKVYPRLSSSYTDAINNRPSQDTINAMFLYLNPGIKRFYLDDVDTIAYFLSVYFYIERNTLNDDIVCRDINNNVRSLNEIVDIFFYPTAIW